VLVVGALLSVVFRGPGDWLAIWSSAAIAVAVQLAAFPLGRIAGANNNLTARMGTGAMMRMFSLIIYGFLAAKVFELSLTPALVSLAAFFFLSSLIEPLLIKS
jgi:hypothetical protein